MELLTGAMLLVVAMLLLSMLFLIPVILVTVVKLVRKGALVCVEELGVMFMKVALSCAVDLVVALLIIRLMTVYDRRSRRDRQNKHYNK